MSNQAEKVSNLAATDDPEAERCNDCGRLIIWDEDKDDYRHETEPGRGCFFIKAETQCEGCDSECGALTRYRVTGHDGAMRLPAYCEDCAGLARMDWNGETASIEKAG